MKIIKILAFIILLSSGASNSNEVAGVEVPLVVAGQVPIPHENPWTVEYIMGKFDPAKDSSFIVVEEKYADRSGLFLRKDTYAAFKEMHRAAKEDGIALVIRSATRNFEYQKGIWERKWTGKTILEGGVDGTTITDELLRAQTILRYSSMPGTSRHHWGTDIDLNAFSNSYFANGAGLEIYTWLQKHASTFGFCQPYTTKGPHRPYGYEEEKWHWSYVPISKQLTEKAKESLSPEMLQGFAGAEQAEALQVIDHYILGIDSMCLVSQPD